MNILTDDEIVANWLEFDSYNEHALPFVRAIEAAIIEKIGEPVAYMEEGFHGSYIVYEQSDRFKSYPLYRLPEIRE